MLKSTGAVILSGSRCEVRQGPGGQGSGLFSGGAAVEVVLPGFEYDPSYMKNISNAFNPHHHWGPQTALLRKGTWLRI